MIVGRVNVADLRAPTYNGDVMHAYRKVRDGVSGKRVYRHAPERCVLCALLDAVEAALPVMRLAKVTCPGNLTRLSDGSVIDDNGLPRLRETLARFEFGDGA